MSKAGFAQNILRLQRVKDKIDSITDSTDKSDKVILDRLICEKIQIFDNTVEFPSVKKASSNIEMLQLKEKSRSARTVQLRFRKFKTTERRLKTLGEHIKQGENYNQNKVVYKQCKEQPPRNRKRFTRSIRVK